MGSRTTYTSTITVPVYASWKCEHCGEINFAAGNIVCKRQETTSSWRNSKHEEAKARAHDLAQAEWAGEAYKVITDPNNSASELYSNVFLQNTRCTKCRKKPRWEMHMKFVPLLGFAMITAIISILCVLGSPTSIGAWLAFLCSAGFITWSIVRENRYKKMMPNFPRQYTPVIGSLNAELAEYAAHRGKSIPSPDECVEIVRNYGKPPVVEKAPAQTVEKVAESSECAGFCRKCGTQLQAGSDFCHKCGTEIVK